MAGTLHTKAQIVTYLSSALIVGLVAGAAAWMIVRDHQAAVDNAEHHLENLAVVVSQQTAFALRTTGEGAVAVLLQKPAREFHGPEHEEFLRGLTTIYAELDLAYSARLETTCPRGRGSWLLLTPRTARSTCASRTRRHCTAWCRRR